MPVAALEGQTGREDWLDNIDQMSVEGVFWFSFPGYIVVSGLMKQESNGRRGL